MTNFPNDPYNQGGGYSGGTVYVQPGDVGMMEPSRTSFLAIAALVVGIIGLLICCIPVVSPVVGALAVFMAIGAMISISSSNGRRRGKALAMTGFVCGVISVILGVLIAIGAGQIAATLSKAVQDYAPVLTAAEAGDVAAFNDLTNGNAQVTEAELRAFADSYRGTMGDYKSIDPSMLNMMRAFMEPGARNELTTIQRQPAVASRQVVVIPSVWTFDKGDAVVILMVEPASATPNVPAGLIEDIIIVNKATGAVVTRLSDVLSGTGPGASGTNAPGTDPASATRTPDPAPTSGTAAPLPDGAPSSTEPAADPS